MNEDLSKYFLNYFTMPKLLIFLLLDGALLAIIYYVLYAYSRKLSAGKKSLAAKEFTSLTERFYEVVFSGTSIIGFMAVYYFINRFVTTGSFRAFWDKYNDFVLLFMMIISILFNTLLDHVFLKIKGLSSDEMASVRLVGMLYMIIIFFYIKFIYEDDNYDMFITYFLTLMIGRFVYFDASFKDFKANVKRAAFNIPLMLLVLLYTALLALYGFKSDYLLTHIGVITNLFVVQLFMCLAIIIGNLLLTKIKRTAN